MSDMHPENFAEFATSDGDEPEAEAHEYPLPLVHPDTMVQRRLDESLRRDIDVPQRRSER